MSKTSTFQRLSGCPQCGGDIRHVTPLSPDVEVYQCTSCPHRFAEAADD